MKAVPLLLALLLAAPLRAADFAAARESFVPSVVALRPEAATSLGLPAGAGRLGVPTADNIARQIAYFEGVEAQLAALPAPTAAAAKDGIDRQVMLAVANSALHELRDRKSYLTDVGAAQGPYDVIQAQLAQAGGAQDWRDILSRAEQVPAYLAAVQANLRAGAAEGRQVYRGFVEKDGVSAGEDAAAFFGGELIQKGGAVLRGEDWTRLEKAGKAAAEAYARHVAFVKAEILPKATEAYGVGEDEYAWKLRNELGVRETPSQLQAKGEALSHKITARMEELARQIDPEKPLPQLMAELRADHPKDDAQLLATYRDVSTRARDFVLQKRMFAIPADYKIDVIETPAGMRSHIGSAAYFPAPPLDPTKKGVFLVTPSGGDPRRLAIHNFAKIPTTVVHEAFPGHDMQFWSFQRAAGLSPVRHLLDQAGYAYSLNVEGYAHYAEELMRQAGFFTPKEELTQLGAQLWRAQRIALDAALHTGRISLEDAARALTEKAFLPEAIAQVEPYRYLKMPTQALTYALGRLEIEALKDEYRAVMGARYSEAEFHRAFLSYGPVLPAMIRPALLAQARAEAEPRWRRALRQPATQVLAWVAAAVAFGAGLYWHVGAQAASEFFSTYLIEWSMSFDNMVVIAAALAAAPAAARAKALRVGLVGAVLARMALITAGVGLVAAHAGLFVVFGAFLLAAAVKMLVPSWDLVGLLTRPFRGLLPKRPLPKWLGPVAVASLSIVGLDVLFALDSVPAALAVSKSAWVIVSANFFSVMGLGALIKVLGWLETKFRYLAQGVAAVLLFVGGKMLAEPLLHLHVGGLASLAVIAGILAASAALSLLRAREA